MKEGMSLDGVAQKNIRHVGQPRPREQLSRRLVTGVKVGKGDQHHEDDRQNGEKKQRGQRRGQQRHMEALVQQRFQLVPEGRDGFAFFPQTAELCRAFQIQEPYIQENSGDGQRQHAVEQDEHGIVAGHPLVDLVDLVPNPQLRVFAKGVEMGQILPAETEEKPEVQRLRPQIQQSLADLAEAKAAAAHHHQRQAGEEIAFFPEGFPKAAKPFFHGEASFPQEIWRGRRENPLRPQRVTLPFRHGRVDTAMPAGGTAQRRRRLSSEWRRSALPADPAWPAGRCRCGRPVPRRRLRRASSSRPARAG